MTTDESWTKAQRHRVVASIDKGVYDILATKVGAPAMFTQGERAGKVYKWSKKGIKDLQGTGENGRLASNHAPMFVEGSEENNIFKIISPATEMDGHVFVRARVPDVLDGKIQALCDSDDHPELVHEVSVECVITEFNDEDMTLDGGYITGISFTMDGHKSRCTLEDGCGVIASELPSNINEGKIMTEIDYKEMYDALKVELDELKAKQEVAASEEIEAIKREKEKLQGEKDSVVASFDELQSKYTSVIASIKKAKLDELRAIVGDDGVKAFEGDDVTVCDIEKTLGVVASLKAKMESEPGVIVNSGAPAEASAPVTDIDKKRTDALKALEKDLKEFSGE